MHGTFSEHSELSEKAHRLIGGEQCVLLLRYQGSTRKFCCTKFVRRHRLALIKLQRTKFVLDSYGVDTCTHQVLYFSGGDAFRGNTRTHPEHDG